MILDIIILGAFFFFFVAFMAGLWGFFMDHTYHPMSPDEEREYLRTFNLSEEEIDEILDSPWKTP